MGHDAAHLITIKAPIRSFARSWVMATSRDVGSRGVPMEFHVQVTDVAPDMEKILDAIHQIDPSAVMDIDVSGQVLRIAAALELPELQALLGHAGYHVLKEQVRQLPSICCGGCSG